MNNLLRIEQVNKSDFTLKVMSAKKNMTSTMNK